MDLMEPKRRRRVGRSSLPRELLLCCLCLCFFSSVFALAAVNRNEATSPQSASSRTDTHSQGRRGGSPAWARRRSLGGPGSYPPRCAGKCGKCTPCKPVHVPVPPGTPVTTEYYPEAWRCKCGNRLYMP